MNQVSAQQARVEELLRYFTIGNRTFKLIACDMDGTLLGPDHRLSSRTIQTMKAVSQKGVTVLLATGRIMSTVKPHLEQLGIPGIVVSHNGALVKDAWTGHIYEHQTLPLDVAWQAVRGAIRQNAVLHWNCDDEISVTGLHPLNTKFSRELEVKLRYVPSFFDLEKEPTSVLVMGPRDALNPVLQESQRLHGYRFDYVLIPWFDDVWQLQYLPRHTSKGSGVLAVAAQLGIQPHEIISFGDSCNDLEMIESSGLGIAMGNAVDELKQAAKFVTLSHDQDGVAIALELLFDL